MKTTYKLLPVVAMTIATLIITPAFAVSDNASSNGQNGSSSGSSNMCTHLANLQTSGNNNVNAKITALQSQYSQQLAKIESDQASVQQNLLTTRISANNQFEEKITALEAIDGLTDEQLQAIETYAESMRTAEATRETAVDTAISDYKTGLESLVSDNQQSMTQAGETFRAAIASAFSVAVSNCSDESNVMTTLRASVKTARENFSSNRQGSGSTMSDDIQALRTTRNEAVKTANQTFAASAKEYSQTLAEVLGDLAISSEE